MRVCLYTSTALPKLGGQELAVDALARHLMALGHEVVVLAPRPRRPLRPDDAGLPYAVARHPRFWSTRFLVGAYRGWLLRLHRARGFEVLHCHGVYPPGYLAALCRDRLGIPTVITSHGGDVRQGSPRLARPALRRRHQRALASADALVAISDFTRRGFARLCPEAQRVLDIPNGVDAEALAARAPRPADLDPAIHPGEYILFLGRLHLRKGVDVLLEALAALPRAAGTRLVIAGAGPARGALEARAVGLGLGGRAHFLGAVTGAAKAHLLQNAACVVVPSRTWESFGLVVLEAYAAGRPVIASDLPGLRDLVRPGETGLLVPPEDPAALVRALGCLLGDRGEAEAMGQRARHAARAYDWGAIAARHVLLYAELLAAGPAAPPCS